MKNIIPTFIYILIFCLLIFSSSYSHEINKNNIDNIIKDFLIKNPDFIKSTLDGYEVSLQNQKRQNAIKSLKNIDNPGIFQKQFQACFRSNLSPF